MVEQTVLHWAARKAHMKAVAKVAQLVALLANLQVHGKVEY